MLLYPLLVVDNGVGMKKNKHKEQEVTSDFASSNPFDLLSSTPSGASSSSSGSSSSSNTGAPLNFTGPQRFSAPPRIIAGYSEAEMKRAQAATQSRLKNLNDLCETLHQNLSRSIPRNQRFLMFLKNALINTLETLIALRSNFKARHYDHLIVGGDMVIRTRKGLMCQEDPVHMLRNGIVHLDIDLPFDIKFDLYLELGRYLSQLKDYEPGKPFKPLNFKQFKDTALYQEALKQEPLHRTKNTATLNALNACFDNIHNYSKNLTITSHTSQEHLRNDYIPLLMAIAEAGEIIKQLPDDISDLTIKDTPFNIFMRDYFIQVRDAMVHYDHPFEVPTVKEIVEYVDSLYPQLKNSNRPI
jgi:hypothetical protein